MQNFLGTLHTASRCWLRILACSLPRYMERSISPPLPPPNQVNHPTHLPRFSLKLKEVQLTRTPPCVHDHGWISVDSRPGISPGTNRLSGLLLSFCTDLYVTRLCSRQRQLREERGDRARLTSRAGGGVGVNTSGDASGGGVGQSGGGHDPSSDTPLGVAKDSSASDLAAFTR